MKKKLTQEQLIGTPAQRLKTAENWGNAVGDALRRTDGKPECRNCHQRVCWVDPEFGFCSACILNGGI